MLNILYILMIGLYILTTLSLEKEQTIKFGMSMRIEYRWIDYLVIFSTSKYIYYYEFLDKLTREEIISIEYEVLQLHTDERNYYYQTEYFYCKNYLLFHQTVIDVLNKRKINYKIHDTHNFDKINYDYKPDTFEPNVYIIEDEIIEKKIQPYPQQQLIIDKSYNYFQINEKGLLIIPCGVGKTLISLWITQKLNLLKIIIGVPNKLLVIQWSNEIKNIFPDINLLLVKGGKTIEDIETFLINNKSFIIITTYSSCHKILNVSNKLNIIFDMKINDECHHLTSINMSLTNNTKKYIQMLNINSIKQISLTATIKNLETFDSGLTIISNDNINYFGEIIDKKTLLWAINENMICDYVIQTIITNEEQLEQQLTLFNIIEENDKRLFLSAYASLKSIIDNNSHHLLIYSNNTDNASKLIDYIKILINNKYFDIPNLYYSNYNSKMKLKDQQKIITKFEQSTYGIITCVYCLGEGWDFPKLDAVVFAENMTSNIRIVQSALRASRKNKIDEPNKITKIILPILNYTNWLENNDNTDLKKVREVIYQMGLEDETISQKIKVFNIEIKKHISILNNKINNITYNFGEYDDELTKLLKLKTTTRQSMDITYDKAKKIIATKNIKSKEIYYDLCDKDTRLSKEPEIIFKGQFTNWIDYLSIKRIYYDFETCKNKINEYLLTYPKFKNYNLNLDFVSNELCNLNPLFPPYGLWVDYYGVMDLQDIIIITNKKKKMGVIL